MYVSVHVFMSIPGCGEPCALVLLNPSETGSLFPAAVHHRPRPSYVTVILTSIHTHKFLQPDMPTVVAHTVLLTSDAIDGLCVFKPVTHSLADRHVRSCSGLSPGFITVTVCYRL